MEPFSIDANGCFIIRPGVGDTYMSPIGLEYTIAAIHYAGVVFEGGFRRASATELQQYTLLKKANPNLQGATP